MQSSPTKGSETGAKHERGRLSVKQEGCETVSETRRLYLHLYLNRGRAGKMKNALRQI